MEIENEKRKKMWAGRIDNNRSGFDKLLEKNHTIEKSNSDSVIGIFMNPTGNYHMPVKYFLESNGYAGKTFMTDARKTEHLRMVTNLGKEKSDPEDAHILAGLPWNDENYGKKKGHVRSPLSDLTRLRESINASITRIKNFIAADLAAVFPEFLTEFSLESKTAQVLLDKYTTPVKISKLSPVVLGRIMKRSSRNHSCKKDAENLIRMASESIGIPDKDNMFTIRIRTNIRRLREEYTSLKELDSNIGNRSSSNEDIRNLTALKGIGIVNAAAIVSEIGDIGQFDSAVKLQSYSGKCPDMTGSGGKVFAKKLTKIRNPHLSHAVHESAISLVMHKNNEFYNLFNRELKKNKPKTEAYIVVGKRLVSHVFSMMKNNKPYKERIPGKVLVNDKRGRGSVPVQT